jgi:hypothetical protein
MFWRQLKRSRTPSIIVFLQKLITNMIHYGTVGTSHVDFVTPHWRVLRYTLDYHVYLLCFPVLKFILT